MTPQSNPQPENVIQLVVDGGFCIGCGACAAVEPQAIRMALDAYGRYQAVLLSSPGEQAAAVCPFGSAGPNEDQIGQQLFGAIGKPHPSLGYLRSTHAGYVGEGAFREAGSSGGMGTWLLVELLERGEVDAVLHVQPERPESAEDPLFRYAVAADPGAVRRGAKSRYYPIEMSAVLTFVVNNPGRYALVGLPCFIKAVRLAQQQQPLLAERIAFCLALVCGHLKSQRYAEMLAWQLEIPPERLIRVDFRLKNPALPANRYGTEVCELVDGEEHCQRADNGELYGTDWGLGMFKYQACDFCDDVVGETADISIGDAWLPQYNRDPGGTNVIIVRDRRFEPWLRQARDAGRIELEDLAPEEVVRSQRGGFFHRRDALAYRLHLWDQSRRWRPQKRLQPAARTISASQRRKQRLRMQIAEESHRRYAAARADGGFAQFQQTMAPLVRRYNAVIRPYWKRAGRWTLRMLRGKR